MLDKPNVAENSRHYIWTAVRKTIAFRSYIQFKRLVKDPLRGENGPVDDVRGQFRNCISVEFAVGANDRKTRSGDGCVKLTQQLRVTVTFGGNNIM